MAVFSVAGTTLGVTLGTPVIPPNATDAEILAAYEALTYTSQDNCIITGLPVVTRDWETSQDPITVCANSQTNALRRSFKTSRIAPNATVTALMDYNDSFIAILEAAQESDVDTITYEVIHPNGVDKIWGQVQVKSFTVDMTDVESRVINSTEWFYEAWPVFSAYL